MMFSDEYFMKIALNEAHTAFSLNEIPVGAIIVCNNSIIAKAHNLTERLTDVTAHAEMQAFTSAYNSLGSKYLSECTLYVTLEPCIMCAGASFWSKIGRIVFGAKDVKNGFQKYSISILHPRTELTSGILEEDCQKILSEFFKAKRI